MIYIYCINIYEILHFSQNYSFVCVYTKLLCTIHTNIMCKQTFTLNVIHRGQSFDSPPLNTFEILKAKYSILFFSLTS